MTVRSVPAVIAGVVLSLASAAGAAVSSCAVRDALAERILPESFGDLAWRTAYNAVVAKDVEADLAWTQVRTREEYDARRGRLREEMVRAIGGLPGRTPLNARVTGIVRRDGYRVEKVYFESVPGAYVTANLFVPECPGFKAPYPGLIVALGHADEGKGFWKYQRAAVRAAKAGFAALMVDPIDQGERPQDPHFGTMTYPVGTEYGMGHNAIGVRAMLLGSSMARIRIWDAMRSVDYLLSRTDVVRPGKVGCMGTSGGGTSTALAMALDDRIGAAAPSCFLTNYRALLNGMAPQDAEQQVFGMLGFGLNHLGLFLMGDVPGAVTSGHTDGFPHYGTYETWRIAAELGARLGDANRYALIDMPGGHGWNEGNVGASLDWMRAKLCGETGLLPLDLGRHRADNVGFDSRKVDVGLSVEECQVLPGGDVRSLPGAKDIHDLLVARLDRALVDRRERGSDELSALVGRLAGIRAPAAADVRRKTLSEGRMGGARIERMAFAYPDGMLIPGVLFVPDEVRGAPAVACADRGGILWGRICTSGFVTRLLDEGRPVLALDVFATGECGENRFYFYRTDAERHPEEAMSVMLYMLGESMVGRRATDLLVAADYLRTRFGGAVSLHAVGRTAIAAAHARAFDRSLVSAVEVDERPRTWTDIVRSRDYCHFSGCVQGALLHYDWPDLLK